MSDELSNHSCPACGSKATRIDPVGFYYQLTDDEVIAKENAERCAKESELPKYQFEDSVPQGTEYIGYECLRDVLREALDQAAMGKGKERHANDRPFDRQPMQELSDMLNTPAGLIFQACKKATEGQRLGGDRAIREWLGAINYLAGAIIYLRRHSEKTPGKTEAT